MIENVYCTRCEATSTHTPDQYARGDDAWHCPRCACPHHSRNDRATVERFIAQWSGLPAWCVRRFVGKLTALALHKIGGMDELRSAAALGLLMAARGYDGRADVKFSTYATIAIERRLQSLIVMHELPKRSGNEVSANVPGDKDGLFDYIPNTREAEPLDAVIAKEQIKAVRAAIRKLEPRLRVIARGRLLKGKSLSEIAGQLGITRQRTFQLEKKVCASLAQSLTL